MFLIRSLQRESFSVFVSRLRSKVAGLTFAQLRVDAEPHELVSVVRKYET